MLTDLLLFFLHMMGIWSGFAVKLLDNFDLTIFS